MDGQRFDALARHIGESRTRRGVLRGIAGTAALCLGLRRSAPVEGKLRFRTAGEPCHSDDQCRAADAPLICADNGFDYDGPLNCCTYVDGRCFEDEGCCWGNVCVNGFCAYPAPSYLGPGDPCSQEGQCRAADTALTCAYVASTGDYRCCAAGGDRCGSDSGCCGDSVCGSGGFCVDRLPFSGPGEVCSDSEQCIGADAPLTCDYVANTDDYRCCAGERSRCAWDSGCCGWLRCGDDGLCTGAPPMGCSEEGCSCAGPGDDVCAPGLVCTQGLRGYYCGPWSS